MRVHDADDFAQDVLHVSRETLHRVNVFCDTNKKTDLSSSYRTFTDKIHQMSTAIHTPVESDLAAAKPNSFSVDKNGDIHCGL